MNSMTKAQRLVYGAISVGVIIVSVMAFLQPRGTTGMWRGLAPIVIGVLGGYSLCLLVTYYYTGKK